MSETTLSNESGSIGPPVQIDLNTEANRIIYVLNKIIQRCKFVGLLGILLANDGELIKDFVDPSNVHVLRQGLIKFRETVASHLTYRPSIDTVSTFDRTSSPLSVDDQDLVKDDSATIIETSEKPEGKSGENERYNKSVTELIYTLEDNKDVVKLAATMEKELSPQMKYFIKCLIQFRDRIYAQLSESAEKYKIREKYLREVYQKNEKIQAEIKKLEEELVVTKTDANVCLIGRHILINRHKNKIQKIQKNCAEAIERRVNESEKEMVNDWQASVAVQKQLKEELDQTSQSYENLLKEHLAIEKVLRAKRAKTENQVLGWIQKFDQDISEKQNEEEEIQAQLDKEVEDVEKIQSKLDEQEEEYDELMQEKAEYEEEMLARRLYKFVTNRSARRIQRTFRLYKARKLAKKLAKKGKKGKKKAK